jgi:hypothetical protein
LFHFARLPALLFSSLLQDEQQHVRLSKFHRAKRPLSLFQTPQAFVMRTSTNRHEEEKSERADLSEKNVEAQMMH